MAFCLDCLPYDVLFEDLDSNLVSAVSSPAAAEALPAWIDLTIDNSHPTIKKVTISAQALRPNVGDAALTGPHQIRVNDGENDVDTDEFSIQVTMTGPPAILINELYEGASPSNGGIRLVLYEGAAPVARTIYVPEVVLLNEVFEGASPSNGGIVLELYEGAAPVAKTVEIPTFPLINVPFEGASPSPGGIVLELFEGASP